MARRTPKRIHMTPKWLDELDLPAVNKYATYYDLKMRHLALLVSYTGLKSFIVYRTLSAKPVRIRIGHYPHISIEDARQRAWEICAQMAHGIDPRQSDYIPSNKTTIEDLYHQYMNNYARLHCKTWKQMEGYFKNYFNEIKDKPAKLLTKGDVQAWHTRLGQLNGSTSANHAVEFLSAILNKAIDWNLIHLNPVSRIKKFEKRQRERFLLKEEVPLFLKAVKSLRYPDSRAFLLLCLFTGARMSNVAAMNWQDIDFDRKVWRIPNTKNGKPHLVPLAPEALEVLQQLLDDKKSTWVFPSDKSKTGYRASFQECWDRVRKRSGLDDLNIHDLRRSLASWEAITGANISVISKTLGHRNIASTQVYARLDIGAVRNAMETAISAMLSSKHQGKKS